MSSSEIQEKNEEIEIKEKKTHEFQKKFTFEERVKESNKIRTKYPDRVPIILERSTSCRSSIPDIDKHKFLVPRDITVGQFLFVIRKRIKLDSKAALFIFIDNKIPSTSSLIGSIYDTDKNKDLFLYVTYSGENTFG